MSWSPNRCHPIVRFYFPAKDKAEQQRLDAHHKWFKALYSGRIVQMDEVIMQYNDVGPPPSTL